MQVVQRQRIEADVLADEILELARGNFPQPLEARDLVGRAELRHRRLLLLFRVAVDRFLLIAHTEERRIQNKQMPVADQVGEELQEKRDQQQPDVHAIHVGIRGDHDFVVAQAVEAFLDVQRRLEKMKLLVLVDHFLREPVGVQRFALQREDRLRLHIARRRQ